MGKNRSERRREQREQGQPKSSMDEILFEPEHTRIRYQGKVLSFESIKAFFGLALLGKMIRFGIDENNNTVVIERMPEGMESFYSEIRRLIDKFEKNPAMGFRIIKETTAFAEKIGLDKELSDPLTGGS